MAAGRLLRLAGTAAGIAAPLVGAPPTLPQLALHVPAIRAMGAVWREAWRRALILLLLIGGVWFASRWWLVGVVCAASAAWVVQHALLTQLALDLPGVRLGTLLRRQVPGLWATAALWLAAGAVRGAGLPAPAAPALEFVAWGGGGGGGVLRPAVCTARFRALGPRAGRVRHHGPARALGGAAERMNDMHAKARRPGAAAPPPAAVRYNDWRSVAMPDAAAFAPARPVSVIVPCYQAPGALALTLAGLECQDWPRDLLEVVVVDDGSEPPLAPRAAASLALTVVRQARDGFGLARARNAGVRAAAHDILVFLDGDVIAEAGLVRAHARWHHAVGDALTVGFCNYVSPAGIDAAAVRNRRGSLAELFAGRAFDPPWLERHMARTDDLTSRHPDLFRAVTGHNFGISRALFEAVGGFDESFTRYGGEDTELAYRAQVRGALQVPVREAIGWHQGRWSEGRAEKRRDMARQAVTLGRLIAEPGFRPGRIGQRFAVPRHVVTLEAREEPVERVERAAAALLGARAGELAVCIDVPVARGRARTGLERRFAEHPRVRVASAGRASALDAFPASPLHVAVPVAVVLGWGAAAPRRVARLGRALGDGAEMSAVLDDGAQVSVARAWALNRARRAGARAADYGETRTLPARLFRAGKVRGLARIPDLQLPRSPLWHGALAVVARVWAEAQHVRGLRTGWRFVRWLAAAARWRLREGRAWAPGRAAARPWPTTRADPPLGVAIAAHGPRARAVFAASTRIVHGPERASVDVALADSAGAAAGVCAPLVLLGDAPALAVPAFDWALDNPVGWVRDVEPRMLALGPVRRLPPGARARRAVAPDDRDALAHCHHVEDVAAFHGDAALRAATLARIAARGVPVRLAERCPALAELLGAELHALMASDFGTMDAAAREALSIAMRRAALRTHSLGARARQLCEAAGVAAPPWPRVSVVLATRRPALLAHGVAGVARQRYPHLELVLALHGPGFDAGAVEAALAGFAHPVKLLRLDASRPLGAVLGVASAEASGPLLAKMDDDDLYGPEHLWDLVLAHGYSGAALVGKFPATVYLARAGCTVRQRAVASETWSRSITGGTMLIARTALERAGGWRALPRHVDEALIGDVLGSGGAVYRTHDAGYVLVRHGDRHAWRRTDGEFLAGAEAVHPGWRPELAGLAEMAPPAGERGGKQRCNAAP